LSSLDMSDEMRAKIDARMVEVRATLREQARLKAEVVVRRQSAKRKFDKVNAPPELLAVGERWWPSRKQFDLWWDYIIPAIQVEGNGYWTGFCPLHDTTRDRMSPTAQFSFARGNARCFGGCWKGTKMTLNSLMDCTEA
jgi:hypothetical protein